MSDDTIHSFADTSALDEALAAIIVEQLASGIRERGLASLAISGGSTPRPLLKRLGEADLAWEKVFVTLVDDRWVPPEHEDSNERMARETLLTGRGAAARFVSLHTDDTHPSAAVGEIEERLETFDTFDCLMLGMGLDGHFASLFPGTDTLPSGLDLRGRAACIAVDPPQAPHARISMTLPRIVDTRRLFLHLTGRDKLEVLQRARERRDPLGQPIAAVLEVQDPCAEIYWAP